MTIMAQAHEYTGMHLWASARDANIQKITMNRVKVTEPVMKKSDSYNHFALFPLNRREP